MSRLIAFVTVALLAAPAYAGHGCFGGGNSYGGCSPMYSSGCGSVSYGCGSVSYGYGGSYGYSYGYGYNCGPVVYGDCGGYVVSQATVSSGCGTSASPVQKVEPKQETVLPPDYYDQKTTVPLKEPTPAVPNEATPAPEKPLPPAESFQSTSYHMTSMDKMKTAVPQKGDGILILHVSPTAKVWINGYPTKQTGTERRYLSKDLRQGSTYTYNIVVDDNGRKGKAVAVLRAGETKTVR